MEMDLIIDNLKLVLDSMQKSYKKIKENDIDGLIVDKVEYKYMNFEDLDEEIDLLIHIRDKKDKNVINSNEEIKVKINDDNKLELNNSNIDISNKANEEFYDDDIDGEPI
jgi:hypothetical protein